MLYGVRVITAITWSGPGFHLGLYHVLYPLLKNLLLVKLRSTRRNGTARCPRILPGPRTCYRTSEPRAKNATRIGARDQSVELYCRQFWAT